MMTPMPQNARRMFLNSLLSLGAGAIATASAAAMPLFRGFRSAPGADARIEILLNEPVGTIAPEIYGHFIEHLGGVIYDGVWVGENSAIPNVRGIRKALIDAMRPLSPGVIRWPGGCFADSYDWRDGVGVRSQRPRRTNMWLDAKEWKSLGIVPSQYEPNQFGTNDFIRLCRLVGARPYVAANLRSLPAMAFHQWVEYCNSPAGSTTWADVRGVDGEKDPFKVQYWGVGNESWGCGGNFTPEEYAGEFRRFTTWAVPEYGVPLRFIGAGPSGSDIEWTRRFFQKTAERGALDRLWGWALHHYSSFQGGDAIAFDDPGWYDLLRSADRMETLITSHWQTMGETDRERRVKLVVDEWGAWYRMSTNVDPSHLFGQQSTMRDAVLAGLTLDTFNRHADKVAMANVAQLINCLHSLFLAHGDRFLRTPTYHAFAMYAAHQGGESVRALFSAPRVSWRDKEAKSKTLWGLNGSASVKGKSLVLTVVNPHITEHRETEIAIRGASAVSASETTLGARDIHAYNSFDEPDQVTPRRAELSLHAGTIVHAFPPASVTKLAIQLR